MKRYLTIIIVFLFVFVIRVNAEDYETGDLIKYNDIKFYVMEDNGDYLTLLKATPLTVDEVNKYGKGYVNKGASYTNCQYDLACDYNGTGYGGVAYDSRDNITSDYNDSDIKHIVDEWSNSVLDQNDLKEVAITYTKYYRNQESITENYKVRLITKDEVSKISKIPTWLNRYTYWTMSPKDSSWVYFIRNGQKDNDLAVDSVSSVMGSHAFTGDSRSPIGVRPVINLNKSASITKIKNNLKDINDTEFKIGDIVEYNGKEFYVLKDSSKTDDKLTMVTKLPLSYEELKNIEDVDYNHNSNTLFGGKIGLEDNKEYYPGYTSYNASGSCHGNIIYRQDDDVCDNNYDNSQIKQIVDTWSDKFFEGKLTKDEMGYKARLITVDDLKDKLGYVGKGGINENTQTESYQMSEDTPFTLENCWTMTPVFDMTNSVYTIENNGNVFQTKISDTQGICPVVTIEKKVAANSDNNNINKDNKVSIPDTLLKNPVFVVVIGIILIVIATITVSLILKRKK